MAKGDGKSRAARLTKERVERLKPGETIRDTEIRGFGARRQRDGIYYFVYCRVRGDLQWNTIGRHDDPYKVEDARRAALNIKTVIANGGDPKAERDRQKGERTVKAAAEEYLGLTDKRLKTRTAEYYRWAVETYVLPRLGNRTMSAISRHDIARIHGDVASGTLSAKRDRLKERGKETELRPAPFLADGLLRVLKAFFAWATERGDYPHANPCTGIKRAAREARRRERYLSAVELARLNKALENAKEPPYALAALRLLLLTGARKSEILTAQWDWIDFKRGVIDLPDSKTGAKAIPLNTTALKLLADLPRVKDNPYVIAGDKEGSHFVGLQKIWQRVRAAAKLPDVRIHDLRHNFASHGAALGESLFVLGRALGHRDQATTQRYAHLADDPVRRASERISNSLNAAMSGRKLSRPARLTHRNRLGAA